MSDFLTFENQSEFDEIRGLPAKISAAGKRASDNGIVILHSELENTIISEHAVASGEYLESIDTSISAVEDFYQATIGSSSDHALEVEEGRQPGATPPVGAILEWMSNVGLEATLFGAILIAQSIAEKGFEGKHIFEKAFEAGAEKVADQFQAEMALAIDK